MTNLIMWQVFVRCDASSTHSALTNWFARSRSVVLSGVCCCSGCATRFAWRSRPIRRCTRVVWRSVWGRRWWRSRARPTWRRRWWSWRRTSAIWSDRWTSWRPRSTRLRRGTRSRGPLRRRSMPRTLPSIKRRISSWRFVAFF